MIALDRTLGQHVADSTHRLDQQRARGVPLDLLAQAGDLIVDGPVQRRPVPAVDQIHQPVPRQGPFGVAEKGRQQLEIGGGQVAILTLAVSQHQTVKIDHQSVKVEQTIAFRVIRRLAVRTSFGSAQNRPDPCQHFADMKGFRQVIICAKFQADDAVDDVVLSGHHHDRYVMAAADVAGDIQPVLGTKVEVKRHKIGRRADKGAAYPFAVLSLVHGKTILFKASPKKSTDFGVVVDHKDLFLSHGWNPKTSL